MITHLLPVGLRGLTAVVLGGIFIRWAITGAAAATLMIGMVVGAGWFALDRCKVYSPDHMLLTFFVCVFCGALLHVLSRLQPEALPASAETCLWQGRPSLGAGSKAVLPAAAAVIGVFIVLYAFFR